MTPVAPSGGVRNAASDAVIRRHMEYIAASHEVTAGPSACESELAGGVPASLALVGAGPRGVAVAARIVADRDTVAPGLPLVVHIIDAVDVGAGRTWRRDQPHELLNNTYCAETTVFADASVPLAGPADGRPSLAQWVRLVATGTGPVTASLPAWAVAEARRSRPWTFPSRPLQGLYYRWALDRIIADAPGDVRFVLHGDTVTALDDDACGRQVLALRGGDVLTVDAVVLAQGTLIGDGEPQVRATASRAAAHGVVYVRPGMPSERPWGDIPAGADVIVTGLGANFFDAIGLLFAGRGGRYIRDDAGALQYVPSGREPRIVAGSRRGLPYRAKAYYPGGLPEPVELPRFSAAREAALVASHAGRGDVVFAGALHDDILADFRDVFERVAADASVADPFDWEHIVFPTAGLQFDDDAAWQAYVDGYLADELFRIRHPDRSPHKAVHRAMETARRRLARLVLAGVFDPVSVVRDLKRTFLPQGLVIASGPPPERLEQLVALRRAGLVEILGPGMTVAIGAEGAVATTAVPGQRRTARVFAEARMHWGNLRTTADPLVRHLIGTGQARFHRVRSGDQTVDTDTLDVTPDAFLLVDAAGRPHDRRVVLGPPAGDVQWYSAIGAVPGTADKLLAGADAAAAHVLRVAARGVGADAGAGAVAVAAAVAAAVAHADARALRSLARG